MNLLTQRLPGLPVGLLRMMFGLLWLQAALQKAPWVINAQGQRFGWLANWLWTETQHPTFGFSKAMLEHVVLPHFTFFGSLSFVVELALGVSLLVGLLTVLSGIGGALWQCNIALGSYAVPGEWGWLWPLLIAPHLVFAFSHAGRSVGVDLFLDHWLSKDPQGQTGLGRFLRYWVSGTSSGWAWTLGVETRHPGRTTAHAHGDDESEAHRTTRDGHIQERLCLIQDGPNLAKGEFLAK